MIIYKYPKKPIINRGNKIKEDYKANIGGKLKNIKGFTLKWEWNKKKYKNLLDKSKL